MRLLGVVAVIAAVGCGGAAPVGVSSESVAMGVDSGEASAPVATATDDAGTPVAPLGDADTKVDTGADTGSDGGPSRAPEAGPVADASPTALDAAALATDGASDAASDANPYPYVPVPGNWGCDTSGKTAVCAGPVGYQCCQQSVVQCARSPADDGQCNGWLAYRCAHPDPPTSACNAPEVAPGVTCWKSTDFCAQGNFGP